MMADFNERRIRRAIAKSYSDAWTTLKAAHDYRETGYTIGYRASFEKVQECRKLIRERRLALRLGRLLTREEVDAAFDHVERSDRILSVTKARA